MLKKISVLCKSLHVQVCMSVHAIVVKPPVFHAQAYSLMDVCKCVCACICLHICAQGCAYARVPLCKSV